MNVPAPVILPYSETAWLIQFDTGLDVAANTTIHQLASWLLQHPLQGLSEVIPAYDSLLVCFSQASSFLHGKQHDVIQKHIQVALESLELKKDLNNVKTVDIPVYYDTKKGSDLAAIAKHATLTLEETIHLHSSRLYHVYMLGFLPGFCYMGEVDSRIAMPRKEVPTAVKAGAVGIAGIQTGIYPLDSPGGWQIVGHTPLKMFDASRDPSTQVQPGMQVKFVPITFSDFQSLLQT